MNGASCLEIQTTDTRCRRDFRRRRGRQPLGALSREPDRTFSVKTDAGENVIEIKDGKIRVKSADCPDQTCVRMGWLSSAAMPIVCLPHDLVITFADGSGGAVDAIAE